MKLSGVFVDIGNLFYCIGKRFPRRKLNYPEYLRQVTGENAVYRAIAYGIQLNDNSIKFQTALKKSGFEVKYKEPRYTINKETNAREIKRTSWNVGLTTDIVRIVDKLDTVIIGSSDYDLVPLVEWIKEKGRVCVVCACGIPKELRAVANQSIEITEDMLRDVEPESAE